MEVGGVAEGLGCMPCRYETQLPSLVPHGPLQLSRFVVPVAPDTGALSLIIAQTSLVGCTFLVWSLGPSLTLQGKPKETSLSFI